ncbi:hypothetical protein SAMN06273572_101611 [Monaibacterium marinum]|uniref:Flavoprotein, HI0933 family n=1 Tax=Pontivivens marinum TaxID=1690039 RepID=A0A2C9CND7_9RHOB|nr:hypothetical protein SAMN06273572_101611 [Monaibacterium marinum]
MLILDHAKSAGEKIRISGGGRCNFTNLHAAPENFLSGNKHFAKSALRRYTQHDFIAMVDAHGIAWHEKTLGQLFCDGSAKQIVAMLVNGIEDAGGSIKLGCNVHAIERPDEFTVATDQGKFRGRSLVVATGGKSIPKMGATGFGYDVARQFGLTVTPIRPALVPLTFGDADRDAFGAMAGLSIDANVTASSARFREGLLFTHRGLSGPSILQVSSYWREGDRISVDVLPATDAFEVLRTARQTAGRQTVRTALGSVLPKRLAAHLAPQDGNIADLNDAALRAIADQLHGWSLTPSGSEGYRTAEVTLGGVDTDGLDSRTMAAKSVPDLYFIGEVVDVTGWLGGYNFQWAWSSGWAAAQAIASD